jgi:hypothetical protein
MVLKIEHQFIHEFPDRSTLFQCRKAFDAIALELGYLLAITFVKTSSMGLARGPWTMVDNIPLLELRTHETPQDTPSTVATAKNAIHNRSIDCHTACNGTGL